MARTVKGDKKILKAVNRANSEPLCQGANHRLKCLNGGCCALNASELLDQTVDKVSEHVARVRTAIASLSEERLNCVTKAHDWSALQILMHLVMSNSHYLPAMEAGIRSARPADSEEVRYAFFARMIMRASGPGGRAPAPRFLHPPAGPLGSEVLDQWLSQQQTAQDLAHLCRGRSINGTRIRNPFLKLFKQSLAECFAILIAHTERHVRQIEEVCTSLRD